MDTRARRSLRTRMLFWTVAVTLPIYAAALYMSYEASARRFQAGAERDVDDLAAKLVAGIDAKIRPIEGGIRTVAYQLEEIDPPPAEYQQRILGILKAWPDVYGSTIAVEAGDGAGNARPFAPYFFRRANDLAFSDLATEKYAYQTLPWYRRPADTGQPVWSSPYYDDGGGNAWMVTYSVPFFRNLPDTRRVLAGVVTADLDLDWVRGLAARTSLGPVGMGWLSAPPATQSFFAPIGVTSKRLSEFDASLDHEAIRRTGDEFLARKMTFGLLPAAISPKPAYLAVRDLETLGWRMMLVIPRAELLAEARELLNRQLGLGAIGLVLLIIAISLVAAGITRPIRALAAAVGKASEENPQFELPPGRRGDEIGVLTEALRRMRGSLQEHIRLRAENLAEQRRMEHELQIAANIQQSMLPKANAVTDLHPAIQVAAALLPARHVGGDLYDYFAVRDGNMLLAVGDVSDKGIPAALFMTRLAALWRIKGATGIPLNWQLARINDRLLEGNEACMFVTMGCGLLNASTGSLRYASAGHEQPLLRRAEGTVKSLTVESGPALGIDAGADYPLNEAFMAPGDTLLLFTDGVTDAEAQDGSMFGLERLNELLAAAPDGDPAALVKRIVDTVAAHAPDFHATDDMTVLAVRWQPAGINVRTDADAVSWHLQPEISDAGVRQAQQWLTAILCARDIEPEQVSETELIAEELLTNIVRISGPPARATRLSIECTLQQTEIVLTFRDDGAQFDPLAHPAPELDVDIADRDVGGLGIALVRQLATGCSYSRIDGSNVLEIRLTRKPLSN